MIPHHAQEINTTTGQLAGKDTNMDTDTIIKILCNHSIPYQVRAGRVLADSMESGTALFEHVTDVTDFSRSELAVWLGY